MVSIQVAEGALQLLLLQQLLLVAGGHQELGEVDPARSIGVDQLENAGDLLRLQGAVGVLEDRDQLIPLDHSIAIRVDLLEGLQQYLLVLVRIEL